MSSYIEFVNRIQTRAQINGRKATDYSMSEIAKRKKYALAHGKTAGEFYTDLLREVNTPLI